MIRIRRKRAFIVKLLIMAGFFFMVGFYYHYHLPRIKQWLLIEAEQLTEKFSPVKMWPQDVDINLIPIGVTFKDIRIQPKQELKSVLVANHLNELQVSLSFWDLLKGQLGVGLVRLAGADVKLFIRQPKESSNKKIGLDFDFKNLNLIPLHKVVIQDISLWAKSTDGDLAVHSPVVNFSVEKKQKSLRVSLQSQSLKVKRTENPAIFKSNVDVRVQVDEKEITVTRLKIQKEDSFLLASGWLEWTPRNLSVNRIVGRTRTNLYMPDVELLLNELKLIENVPQLKGRVNLELKTDHRIGAKQEGDFELETRDLKVNGYEVGSIIASGKGDREQFKFDRLTVKHSGGSASVKNLVAKLKSPYTLSGQVTGSRINVHTLLEGIKVPKVPVFTSFSPNLNCTARLAKGPKLDCRGSINFDHLNVRPSVSSDREIVGLKDGTLSGAVSVNNKEVIYKSDIKLKHSKGESSGTINYATGFKIDYSASELNLKDFEKISGIHLEGTGSLKGSTAGNSKTATLDMNIASKDFFIDDFGLGAFTSTVKYRKGSLFFNEINGSHRSTQYNGNVTLNLNKERIFIDATLPFVDIENIQELLDRKINIRAEVTGTGNARLIMRGPFDLNKMSYEASAQIYRGVIAEESYDQINLRLSSDAGQITAEELSLTKGSGVLRISGSGKMGDKIDAQIAARGFRVEQSENLSQRDIKLGGILDFDSSVSGTFDNPNINGSGALRNVLLGDTPVAGAKFNMLLKDHIFSGQAEFGTKIASFGWRLGLGESDIVEFSGKFNDWDFSQAFSMFSDNLRTNSYSANLKGTFEFFGNKQNLNISTANVELEKLTLKANNAELTNSKPMQLTMKDGVVRTTNFRMSGSGGYARLVSDQTKAGQLDLKLDGRAELSLISILTPFLDDIRGQLNVGLAINGTPTDPLLSGNIYITKAFVRAEAFPHGLEEASADILFDKNKLIINNVKGKLAGGSATASGQIIFNDVKDIDVDINGQFFDSNFLIPAGFNTRGNGNVSIQGNWFPYKLLVNYDVATGRVDREFKAEKSSQREIKPSAYLPKFLAEKRFAPLSLDIKVNLPNEMPVKLRITRLDVDSKISGNIRVMGQPEEPLLDGRIQIKRGGLITFRENVFEVQSGYVEYKNERPDNPKLNISAESQVRAKIGADDQEKDFDVSLRVLGSAAEPVVTVSSQPALSEAELLSLLTLGFISDAGGDVSDSTSSEGDITNTSYQLGSAFLNEQLGLNRELGKRLGVQFDFSSAFDSDDNAAIHTFTIKKQWTPKFGTSASRSVGKTNTNKFEAKYRLNNNVSVIGNYEGKEQTGASDSTESDEEDNLFGLDIEYRVDFK